MLFHLRFEVRNDFDRLNELENALSKKAASIEEQMQNLEDLKQEGTKQIEIEEDISESEQRKISINL